MSHSPKGQRLSTQSPKDQFTQVPNSVLTLKGVSPVEKLILIYLHRYTNLPDWAFYYSKIAQDLGLDESGVRRSWKKLQDKKLILDGRINYALIEKMQAKPGLSPGMTPNESGILSKDTGTESNQSGTESRLNRDRIPDDPGLSPAYKEVNKERDKEVTINTEQKKAPIEVSSFNSNEKDMITKEMVLIEIKERGLKVNSINGVVNIFQSNPENGMKFKKGDYDKMLKEILDYPSIKISPSVEVNNKEIVREVNNNSINPEHSNKGINTIQPVVSTIDSFLFECSMEIINKYASMERSQLYQTLNSTVGSSINILDLICEIKKRSNNKTLVKVQSSDLRVTPVTQDVYDRGSSPTVGEVGCASDLDSFTDEFKDLVGYVTQDLLERGLLKSSNQHIPTWKVFVGLTNESTEKEVRQHVYNFYKTAYNSN